MKLFRRCRRQWELKYVEGIGNEDSDYRNKKADIGTLVHMYLEAHYKDTEDGYLKAKRLFEIASPDTRAWANTMISGYLDWLAETGVDAGWKIEGVELELRVPWGEPRYNGDYGHDPFQVVMQGHVDLLATDAHGQRKLVDHKTVDSLDSYARQLQVDTQMLTYAVLLEMQGIEISGAIHNAIKRSKRTSRATPPFYQRNEVHYNTAQIIHHRMAMEATIRGMLDARLALESGVDRHSVTYPNPTKDCTWDCPFLSICPMMDDGSNAEAVIKMMK
ncbi:MAG: PD-(D/E)XK nuclease family protein [Candidatus Dormibacteria bacterium]